LPELIGKKFARQYGLRFSPLPLDIVAGTQSMAWHVRHEADSAQAWLRKTVVGSVRDVVAEMRNQRK